MTNHQRTSPQPSTSRRGFLQWAGAASLAAAAGGSLSTAAAEESCQAGCDKVKFQLGMASYTLRKFDLGQALAKARRLGLKYICLKSFHLPLDATAEQIAAAVAKVKEAGLTLYGGGVIGMEDQQQVDQAFQYAKAAGMKTIVGVPAPELLTMVEGKVKEYDIRVAIHNHGPGDKTYPTPRTAYEKIQGLDKRIGLCNDIGHTVRYGEDLIKTTEQCADRLLDVHLKDVTEASAKGRACPAGRGVVDLPGFLKTLVKIGYSGVASLEYESDPDDPLAGAAESIGYVRGILAMID